MLCLQVAKRRGLEANAPSRLLKSPMFAERPRTKRNRSGLNHESNAVRISFFNSLLGGRVHQAPPHWRTSSWEIGMWEIGIKQEGESDADATAPALRAEAVFLLVHGCS